jgi:hypothetical protein
VYLAGSQSQTRLALSPLPFRRTLIFPLGITWLDYETKVFQDYDMNTYPEPGYTSTKTFTLVTYENGCTVAELQQWAVGSYVTQRRTYIA